MDVQFLGTTIAPIVQAVTSLAGVVGLLLVWHQIKQTNDWNRANTQHALLSNLPSQELETQFSELLKKLPKDQKHALTKEAIPLICEVVSDWVCVKTYLSKHEQFCAAINANAVDDNYAYHIHNSKFTHLFIILELYIKYARTYYDDPNIYLEFEKVATRWIRRAGKEKAKTIAQQAQLLQQRGTSNVVG